MGLSVYLGQNENIKSTRLCQKYEKEFGLTITKGPDIANEMSKPKKGEIEKTLRTGKAPERSILQKAIQEAIHGNPTIKDFVENLNAAGIKVIPNIASTGRMNGFSFQLSSGELAFSGSKLGKAFKWSALQKELDYDTERDNEFLQNLKKSLTGLGNTIDEFVAEDITSKKDKFKQYLASELFKNEVKFKDIKYVDVESRTITFIGNGKLFLNEEGNRIIASGMTSQEAAERIVDAGLKAGWESMSFTGSDEFVRLAMKKAIENKINVVAKTREQEEMLREVKNGQVRSNRASGRTTESKPNSKDQDNSTTSRNDRDNEQVNDRFSRRAESDHLRNSKSDQVTSTKPENTKQIDQGISQSDRLIQQGSTGKNNQLEHDHQQKSDRLVGNDTFSDIQSIDSRMVNLSTTVNVRTGNSLGVVQQAQQSRTTINSESDELEKIKNSVQQIENLAAPLLHQKGNDKTTQAVIDQLNQMRCRMYEVGIFQRDKKLMMNREMSASEIVKSIPRLKRDNAKGNDIYIRPAKDENAGLVLVDDIDQLTIEEMIEDERHPALVVETSHKNYQAWVRIADTANDVIRIEASRALANVYGGDIGSVDARHYGRLAGFTNRKIEHQSEYGIQPYCLLSRDLFKREDALKVTDKLKQDYEKAKTKAASKAAHKEHQKRLDYLKNTQPPVLPHQIRNLKDDELYRYKYQQLERVFGKDFNASVADYRIAKSLLEDNFSSDVVKEIIKENSPALAKRKGNHIDGYLTKTLSKATAEVSKERSEKKTDNNRVQSPQKKVFQP